MKNSHARSSPSRDFWLLPPEAESSDDSRWTTRLVTKSLFAIWCWLGSAKWDIRVSSLKATICYWGRMAQMTAARVNQICRVVNQISNELKCIIKLSEA